MKRRTRSAPPKRGRVIAETSKDFVVQSQSGTFRVARRTPPASPQPVGLGDWIEVKSKELRVATPNRTAPRGGDGAMQMRHTLDPRRLHATQVRTKVEHAIRSFFLKRDFIETRTPLLTPSPGMEPHIRPFEATPLARTAHSDTRRYFIPTSPEFSMKRLLVGGLERIFQITPAFRDEPESTTHLPEFTMLEWYRAWSSIEDIMCDTEKLIERIAIAIHGKPVLTFAGKKISVKTPWPRLRVRDLFAEHAGIDLVQCATAPQLAQECARLGIEAQSEEPWDDLYFRIWLNVIEPRLPAQRAVFVTRYPASQAALSVIDQDPDGSRWAKRFEVYIAGIELANAFEELTDPVEQRRRFEHDMNHRTEVYGDAFPQSPLDEKFLGALEEGMPPSGGIALGVDRLVMLMANESDIHYTFWLPPGA